MYFKLNLIHLNCDKNNPNSLTVITKSKTQIRLRPVMTWTKTKTNNLFCRKFMTGVLDLILTKGS